MSGDEGRPRIEDVAVIWTSADGVLSFLRDPEQGLGGEGLERALDTLPAAHRAALVSDHGALDRVPLVALNRLVEQAARQKGVELESFAKAIGRFAARHSPVLRVLTLLLTPLPLVQIGSYSWQRIFGCGQMRARASASGATVVVTNFPSETSCCGRIQGWLEVLAEEAGGRNARSSHPVCIARGDPHCVFEVGWDA